MATLGAHALTSNSHSLWRSSRAEYRYWWKRKFVLFCFAGLTVFHFVFVQNTDNKKSDGEKKIKKQESTARERRQKRSKKEVKKVLLASCRRVLYNLCESQPIFWLWILWSWPVRCVCVERWWLEQILNTFVTVRSQLPAGGDGKIDFESRRNAWLSLSYDFE